MAEEKNKAKVGDMKPVYQQVGWEVCRKAAEKPEGEEWIPTEKLSEAVMLSVLLSGSEALKKEE